MGAVVRAAMLLAINLIEYSFIPGYDTIRAHSFDILNGDLFPGTGTNKVQPRHSNQSF